MRVPMGKSLLASVAMTLPLSACQTAAPTPSTTPTTAWPLPPEKYLFVERWIEVYEDSGLSAYIDFPTYTFDPSSGALAPHIVPPGRWFPLEDLTALKVVYGRGTSRTGHAGMGTNSRVFALTDLPFTEPEKDDTNTVVVLERVDTQGAVRLRRGQQQIVLPPGQAWTWDDESIVTRSSVTSNVRSRERVTNYGAQAKSDIQLTK